MEESDGIFVYGPYEIDLSNAYAYIGMDDIAPYGEGFENKPLYIGYLRFDGYNTPNNCSSRTKRAIKKELKKRYHNGLVAFKQRVFCTRNHITYAKNLSDIYLLDGTFICPTCKKEKKYECHTLQRFIAEHYNKKIKKNIPCKFKTKYGLLELINIETETKTSCWFFQLNVYYGYHNGERYRITDYTHYL